MREPIQDNIYLAGARVLAKEDPIQQFIILVDDPGHPRFAYFKRQLIPTGDNIAKKITG